MATVSRREWTRRVMAVFLGVSASLLVIFSSIPENFIINIFERKIYDAWMRLRGDIEERNDIQIIGITSDDLEALGHWPWPLAIQVEILNTIAEYQPAAILLDIIYAESEIGFWADASEEELRINPDAKEWDKRYQADAAARALKEHYEESHQIFVKTLKSLGNVYLAAYLNLSEEAEDATAALEIASRIRSFPAFNEDNFLQFQSSNQNYSEILLKIPRGSDYEVPLKDFAENAAGFGFINADPDHDGITRKTRLLGRIADRVLPSLDLVVLSKYLGSDLSDFQIFPGQYLIIPQNGREYRIPITEDGQMYINFKGSKAYLRKSVSVTGFLSAHLKGEAEDIIKGKIVLVGMLAEGSTDIRAVSVDSYYPLVALHATVLDNILSRNPVLVLPGWLRITLLISLGLAIGLVLPIVRPWAGTAICFLFLAGTIFLPHLCFRYGSYWIPTVQPALTVSLAFLEIVFYHFIVERVQRRHIQEVFGRCVDRAVVDQIVDSGLDPQLGGNRAEVTVMFADISNFTPYSEINAAEQVVGKLNEYFTAMTDVIFHHQGTIDKYMGDCIMVFYGNPIPMEDHAYRAVKTAIEMQILMKELQNKWGASGFSQSIGINTGEVVVGWMGSPSKKEYTVIGDTVNTAFRIEGVATAGQVLISQTTYEILQDQLIVESLEPVSLKGKSEPQKIYAVIGFKREQAYSPDL